MFRRKPKPRPLPPAHLTFVSAREVEGHAAALAAGPEGGWTESAPMQLRPPERPAEPVLRSYYASRVTRPRDSAWRYMASCVIVAEDINAAHKQLADALRQRASAASADDYVISAVPVGELVYPDHGIVLTTMVDP